MTTEIIIAQTKKWIVDVVIGCNFCPFAAKEIKKNTIHFEVLDKPTTPMVLTALTALFEKMNKEQHIETAFLILPHHYDLFATYLKLIKNAEKLLYKSGLEGVYQIATFHPHYLFAGSTLKDPANYTNRSPYPMLQLLREESVSHAVETYPDTHKIPIKNTAFARRKGLAYMQNLLATCM
jgi:hypothetical protein